MIVVCIVFMAIKIIILRREARNRGMVMPFEDGEDGMMMQNRPPRRNVFLGVPPDVINTFPLFKFEASTFVRSKDVPQQERSHIGSEGGEGEDDDDDMIMAHRGTEEEEEPRQRRRARRQGDEVDASGDASPHAPTRPAGKPAALTADGEDGSEAPQCSVCIMDFEEGEDLRRLPCLHVFHQACIDQWMTQHRTCPNCRTALCPHYEQQPSRMSAENPDARYSPRLPVVSPYHYERGQESIAPIHTGWGHGSPWTLRRLCCKVREPP